jgi:hypothetical protein
MPSMTLLQAIKMIEGAGLRAEITSHIDARDKPLLWVHGWESFSRHTLGNLVVTFPVTGGGIDRIYAANIREKLADYKPPAAAPDTATSPPAILPSASTGGYDD